MITLEQKEQAYAALRAAGFESPIARELLAGPKGLRDEFAGRAMQALADSIVTESGRAKKDPNTTIRMLTEGAYKIADAMMRARSEP